MLGTSLGNDYKEGNETNEISKLIVSDKYPSTSSKIRRRKLDQYFRESGRKHVSLWKLKKHTNIPTYLKGQQLSCLFLLLTSHNGSDPFPFVIQ